MSEADGVQKIQHDNDEIDLRDLVVALWNGKGLILGVTALVTALALAYLLIVPQTFKASMEIRPIDSFQAATYKPLSDDTGLLHINDQTLINWFFENPTPTLIENMVKLNYIEKQPDESDQEFLLRVTQVADKFEFVAPTVDPKTKIKHINGTISFTTKKPALSRQLISQVIVDINTNIQANLQALYALNLDQYQSKLDGRLQDIDIQIKSYYAAHEARTNRKITELAEQAQIARSLSLADSQLVNSINYGGDIVLMDNNSVPTYLHGYLALEKAIELLEARNYAKTFIPEEVDFLLSDRYALINDKVLERAEQQYLNTPLAGDNFQAVNYQMTSLQIKPGQSAILVLSLAIILGAMLGTLVLVVRNLINGDRPIT